MKQIRAWLYSLSWRRVSVVAAIVLVLAVIGFQFMYSYDKTVPFAVVNGVEVGGLDRQSAVNALRELQEGRSLDIYFGESDNPYRSPTLGDLGFTDNIDTLVDELMYPWWLRMVPSSVVWGHYLLESDAVEVALRGDSVEAYARDQLGDSCRVDPRNARVQVGELGLELVQSEPGGSCSIDEVIGIINEVDLLEIDPDAKVPMNYIPPEIDNDKAQAVIDDIEDRLSGGVVLTYGSSSIELDEDEVRSWLTFTEKSGEIVAGIDSTKSKDTLIAKLNNLVSVAPGVVTITTYDFREISRTGGGEGRSLAVVGTSGNIAKYVNGVAEKAIVAYTVLKPRTKYIRSYSSSDTGLSALIQHYSQSQPGTYGVSLIELSGARRHAGYNQTKVFFPASTYKVFIAYSVLRQVEAGKMKWTDRVVGSKNLQTCFDDMIVISDNACPEELTLVIGKATLNTHLAELGLTGSRFIARGEHQVTAQDLSKFMANLQTGQLPISDNGRNRLLSALKRNIYRQGISAGASGVVANKVGFLNSLLHDTAIVYSPKGAYVLTILTDGSSWANIANLTREIEELRSR